MTEVLEVHLVFHFCVNIRALCLYVPMLQEREGRKDVEPRSEDGQFEEVTVQQLLQVERGGNPVSAHTHSLVALSLR